MRTSLSPRSVWAPRRYLRGALWTAMLLVGIGSCADDAKAPTEAVVDHQLPEASVRASGMVLDDASSRLAGALGALNQRARLRETLTSLNDALQSGQLVRAKRHIATARRVLDEISRTAGHSADAERDAILLALDDVEKSLSDAAVAKVK